MRTFAGFSHYTASPSPRRPPGGEARASLRPGEPGRESLAPPAMPRACRVARRCATLWKRCDEKRRRAIGSAGERLVHTEEVTGSIPVSPTGVLRLNEKLAGLILHRDGAFRRAGEFSAASCRSCWKS